MSHLSDLRLLLTSKIWKVKKITNLRPQESNLQTMEKVLVFLRVQKWRGKLLAKVRVEMMTSTVRLKIESIAYRIRFSIIRMSPRQQWSRKRMLETSMMISHTISTWRNMTVLWLTLKMVDLDYHMAQVNLKRLSKSLWKRIQWMSFMICLEVNLQRKKHLKKAKLFQRRLEERSLIGLLTPLEEHLAIYFPKDQSQKFSALIKTRIQVISKLMRLYQRRQLKVSKSHKLQKKRLS